MSNEFFNLSSEEQLALIRQAGDKFDIPDVVIEKDFWICWLLGKLFLLPEKMVFKGGTSLSKVFGLIMRFSEDVDITVDYSNFKKDLDLSHINRSQLKKISGQLRERLREYISNTVQPYFQREALKVLGRKKFEITLGDDGEQLRFYYPSVLNDRASYLRDHVLIEFGVRNSVDPCEKHSVTPYLAQVTGDGISFPQPKIYTLSPLRTFWEKATLIHVECHRDHWIKTSERLSRHWYDLFMLNNSKVGNDALLRDDILKSVIEHKKAFFHASYARYDDCLKGKFRLIPKGYHLKVLTLDFYRMIEAGMFHEKPPTFEKIIESLQRLEATLMKFNLE